MKKILFYLPNLHHGGAEGVMVDVANYLLQYDFDITFVFVKKEGVLLGRLDLRIKKIDLNLRNQWFAFIKLPFVIRNQKPDYVFSTMKESNFIAILSRILVFSKAKNIIREANTVTQQITNEARWYQRIKNKIIFHFYKYADHVVALSESMKKDLQTVVPSLEDERVTVIPNPINIEKIETLSLEPIDRVEQNLIKNRPLFLSVGRLHEQKNYGFLFEALAEYRKKGNEFTFFALGEGPLRKELEKKIASLALDDCCYLIGYRSNPYKYMKKADVFLLPSLYEGMSNSLIQATFLNTSALVSDSQSGSLEWLNNTSSGYYYKENNITSFIIKINLLVKKPIKENFVRNYLNKIDIYDEYRKLF